MGIRNIDNLSNNPSVDPSEPTKPPTPDNTQAGVPTPIDNIAKEEPTPAGEDSTQVDDGGE